ncbi:MAG: hypothetical protein MUF21_07785, partial [Gemmatimonadaceae bacterium]|nr:hypothetical protein [Gemmatimonadaceae bacterium]
MMMHEGAPMVFPAARAVDRRRAPAVRGQPRLWIRAEGAAIAIAAFAAWVQLTGRPGLFALLFL